MIGQTQMTQFQFGQINADRQITAFSPPGLTIEAAKYPILMAGVLAAVEPSEWLSIYDHPESWRGLDRDAILSMRKRLFRFTIPIDARAKQPRESLDTLQTIALSVSPIALAIKATCLPPKSLHPLGGQLPAGSEIFIKSIEILSEPEISRVAQRIVEQDMPASEGAWRLFSYEYSLDQVARLMSVGLLGRESSRRLIPTRGAYKAVIDSFVNRCTTELADRQSTSSYRLSSSELFDENFTIIEQPGDPQVNYLRIERGHNGFERGVSLEGTKNLTMDSKTAVFADHARFAAYQDLLKRKTKSHLTIFHFARNNSNAILGPWVVRAGVRAALESNQIELDTKENALALLRSLLAPDISIWSSDNSLIDSLGGAFTIIENSSPRTRYEV